MRTGKEKKIKMPKNCPTCGASVEKRMTTDSGLMKNSPAFLHPTGRTFRGSNSSQGHSLLSPTSSTASVAYFCTNKNCPAKNERYLEHFVSVFGIYELGPKILRRFKDEGLITDAADIFKLTKEDIAPLERFGEKSAENIVDEINNKKKISLARFIWSLGILHVGEETARDLANHFGTLEKLINSARGVLAEVDSIENIGQAVSKSIASFFTDSNNLKFIKKLQDNGVVIEKSQKQNKGKFTGLTFVLTGTLSNMSREIAKEKILSLGGKVGSTVSKNTSYVLAGSEPGSKFELAQKLGIKILGEDDFNKLLNNN
jgi:DNA ligase (NAD+)